MRKRKPPARIKNWIGDPPPTGKATPELDEGSYHKLPSLERARLSRQGIPGDELLAHPQIIIPDDKVLCDDCNDCDKTPGWKVAPTADSNWFIECKSAPKCKAGGCTCALFQKKKEPGVKEDDWKEDWTYVVEQDKEYQTTGKEAVKFDWRCICLKPKVEI